MRAKASILLFYDTSLQILLCGLGNNYIVVWPFDEVALFFIDG